MKRRFIDSLVAGEAVDDVFALAEKTVGQKKDGAPFLTLTLADRTGTLAAKVWDDVSAISAAAGPGDVARVSGVVTEYRGERQVTVKNLVRLAREEYDPADFLPRSARDPARMLERLKSTLRESITDPFLLRLLDAFWADEEFTRAFLSSPGAKKMHHAYLGGLLEHTLSMTVLAREIAKHYSGVDLNLLLTGVVLHDIGKTRELVYDTVIDYSDMGRLVPHIVMGCAMVAEKIRAIDGFPKETAMRIQHMIVSHHGSREFGSPEPPKTLEAVLLHHIDDIDAKMSGLREFISKEDPQAAWTSRCFMLGTPLYKGKTDGGEKE